jgi:hypothetical protein
MAVAETEAARLAAMIRINAARAALQALQPGEWEEVMAHFCKSCGCNDPRCQCWNAWRGL